MNPKRLLTWIAGVALFAAASAHAALINVTADITGTNTWYATNTYVLKTVVYVQSNAVLNIEPGTVVKGANTGLTSRPGIPLLVSALRVTRGGKLYATGTVERPIIFTAEADPVNGTWLRNAGVPVSGQWGGAVLLGKAAINSAQNLVGSSRVDLQACKLEYSIVSPK